MHHFNIPLRSGLPAKDVVILLIQTTSFECQLCILKIVNCFYVLKQVEAITYPTMHKVLASRDIEESTSFMGKVKAKLYLQTSNYINLSKCFLYAGALLEFRVVNSGA